MKNQHIKQKKPRIGIVYTGANHAKQRRAGNYMRAVRRAGGQPVFLPWCAEKARVWARKFDGFVFTGGGDPDPAFFGQEMLTECGKPDPRRDTAELALLAAVLPTGKPVLGICRGEQMLNVAMGGTLVQDIPSQRPEAADEHHSDDPGRFNPTHKAILALGTRLREWFGCEEILTNSIHHQAVDAVAPGLTAAAHSPAGIVEAVETTAPDRFLLGVQWHPEALAAKSPAMQRIFDELVAACRK